MPGSVARNRQLLRQPRQRARGQHPRHGARRPVVVDGQPRSTGRPAGRRSRRLAARLRRSLVAALPMGYMRGAVAGGRVRNAGMAAVALGTPALVVGDTRRFIPERRLRHPRHRARVQHPRRGARGRVVVGGRPRWTVPSAGRQNAVRRGGGCAGPTWRRLRWAHTRRCGRWTGSGRLARPPSSSPETCSVVALGTPPLAEAKSRELTALYRRHSPLHPERRCAIPATAPEVNIRAIHGARCPVVVRGRSRWAGPGRGRRKFRNSGVAVGLVIGNRDRAWSSSCSPGANTRTVLNCAAVRDDIPYQVDRTPDAG